MDVERELKTLPFVEVTMQKERGNSESSISYLKDPFASLFDESAPIDDKITSDSPPSINQINLGSPIINGYLVDLISAQIPTSFDDLSSSAIAESVSDAGDEQFSLKFDNITGNSNIIVEPSVVENRDIHQFKKEIPRIYDSGNLKHPLLMLDKTNLEGNLNDECRTLRSSNDRNIIANNNATSNDLQQNMEFDFFVMNTNNLEFCETRAGDMSGMEIVDEKSFSVSQSIQVVYLNDKINESISLLLDGIDEHHESNASMKIFDNVEENDFIELQKKDPDPFANIFESGSSSTKQDTNINYEDTTINTLGSITKLDNNNYNSNNNDDNVRNHLIPSNSITPDNLGIKSADNIPTTAITSASTIPVTVFESDVHTHISVSPDTSDNLKFHPTTIPNEFYASNKIVSMESSTDLHSLIEDSCPKNDTRKMDENENDEKIGIENENENRNENKIKDKFLTANRNLPVIFNDNIPIIVEANNNSSVVFDTFNAFAIRIEEVIDVITINKTSGSESVGVGVEEVAVNVITSDSADIANIHILDLKLDSEIKIRSNEASDFTVGEIIQLEMNPKVDVVIEFDDAGTIRTEIVEDAIESNEDFREFQIQQEVLLTNVEEQEGMENTEEAEMEKVNKGEKEGSEDGRIMTVTTISNAALNTNIDEIRKGSCFEDGDKEIELRVDVDEDDDDWGGFNTVAVSSVKTETQEEAEAEAEVEIEMKKETENVDEGETETVDETEIVTMNENIHVTQNTTEQKIELKDEKNIFFNTEEVQDFTFKNDTENDGLGFNKKRVGINEEDYNEELSDASVKSKIILFDEKSETILLDNHFEPNEGGKDGAINKHGHDIDMRKIKKTEMEGTQAEKVEVVLDIFDDAKIHSDVIQKSDEDFNIDSYDASGVQNGLNDTSLGCHEDDGKNSIVSNNMNNGNIIDDDDDDDEWDEFEGPAETASISTLNNVTAIDEKNKTLLAPSDLFDSHHISTNISLREKNSVNLNIELTNTSELPKNITQSISGISESENARSTSSIDEAELISTVTGQSNNQNFKTKYALYRDLSNGIFGPPSLSSFRTDDSCNNMDPAGNFLKFPSKGEVFIKVPGHCISSWTADLLSRVILETIPKDAVFIDPRYSDPWLGQYQFSNDGKYFNSSSSDEPSSPYPCSPPFSPPTSPRHSNNYPDDSGISDPSFGFASSSSLSKTSGPGERKEIFSFSQEKEGNCSALPFIYPSFSSSPLPSPFPSSISLLLSCSTSEQIKYVNDINDKYSNNDHDSDTLSSCFPIPAIPLSSSKSPPLTTMMKRISYLSNDCITQNNDYHNCTSLSGNLSNSNFNHLNHCNDGDHTNLINEYHDKKMKYDFYLSSNCITGNNSTNTNIVSLPHLEFGIITNSRGGNPDNNSCKSVEIVNTNLTVVTENKFLSSENNSIAFKEFDQLCSRTIGSSVEVFRNLQESVPGSQDLHIPKNSNHIQDEKNDNNILSLSIEASNFLTMLPDYSYLIS